MNSERRELFHDRKRAAEGGVRDADWRRELAERDRARRQAAHQIASAWHRRHNERVIYQPRPRTFALHVSPALVGVSTHMWDRQGKAARLKGGRGAILALTAKAREGFKRTIARTHWPAVEYVFPTLTYPNEFPHDPAIWRLHVKAYEQAWRRDHGELRAVRAREFQGRGAPHWHYVAIAPAMPLPLLRRWHARTWHRIVTGCPLGEQHLARGAVIPDGCDPWHYERALADESLKVARDAKGAMSYLAKELGKESQKSLPSYLDGEGAGRWFGILGFEPEDDSQPLDGGEYKRIRRTIREVAIRLARKQRAELDAFRLRKIARGHSWSGSGARARRRAKRLRAAGLPAPNAPGAWLRQQSGRDPLQGLTVRDPELRGDRLRRMALDTLASMRGAVRGSFAAIEQACPQPRMGWA